MRAPEKRVAEVFSDIEKKRMIENGIEDRTSPDPDVTPVPVLDEVPVPEEPDDGIQPGTLFPLAGRLQYRGRYLE